MNDDGTNTTTTSDDNAPDKTPEMSMPEQSSSKPQSQEDQKPKSSRKQKRNTAVAVLAFLLVIVGAYAIYAVFINSDETVNPPVDQNISANRVVELAAAISLTEGSVETSLNGKTWKAAAGGETVSSKHYVRTMADSRAVLLLDDGSAVRLDADTEIQLATSDSKLVEIKLVSGQVYTRVVESESRTFAVITDSERFEAQGTAYRTSTDSEKDSVEVYQSSVKVDSDETTIEEGNRYDTSTREKSDIDLAALSDDAFVQWNKQKDSEKDEFKDKLGVLSKEAPQEPAPAPAGPNAGISLSGVATDKGVKLSWSLTGVSSTDGFKLVRDATDTTPTYKENKSVYVSKGEQTSYTIELSDGKTYNFRVCIYRAASGTCDTYSNSVKVKAPLVAYVPVVNGAVSLDITGGVINWTFGGTAPHGFKVVMNTEGDPTYPSHGVQYVGPGGTSSMLPEKPAATYKVRICKYTANSEIDGGCTDYSNPVDYVVSP